MDFVYPKNLKFSCNNCGICCGDTNKKERQILMFKEEVNQISNKTSRKISDFAIVSNDFKPYSFLMNKNKNGKCIFLSQKNKCCIYSDRPLICRFYPIELSDLINKKHKFSSTNECPGINHGNILDKKYFSDLFELAKSRFQKSC